MKTSLQWDLPCEYLARMVNQTVKVYSDNNSSSMLKSRQSHGTFEINEKENPFVLVVNLCIHHEVMPWDYETVTIVIEGGAQPRTLSPYPLCNFVFNYTFHFKLLFKYSAIV